MKFENIKVWVRSNGVADLDVSAVQQSESIGPQVDRDLMVALIEGTLNDTLPPITTVDHFEQWVVANLGDQYLVTAMPVWSLYCRERDMAELLLTLDGQKSQAQSLVQQAIGALEQSDPRAFCIGDRPSGMFRSTAVAHLLEGAHILVHPIPDRVLAEKQYRLLLNALSRVALDLLIDQLTPVEPGKAPDSPAH